MTARTVIVTRAALSADALALPEKAPGDTVSCVVDARQLSPGAETLVLGAAPDGLTVTTAAVETGTLLLVISGGEGAVYRLPITVSYEDGTAETFRVAIAVSSSTGAALAPSDGAGVLRGPKGDPGEKGDRGVDGDGGVTSIAGRSGVVTLGVADVTGAYPSANPAGYVTAQLLSAPSIADYTTGNPAVVSHQMLVSDSTASGASGKAQFATTITMVASTGGNSTGPAAARAALTTNAAMQAGSGVGRSILSLLGLAAGYTNPNAFGHEIDVGNGAGHRGDAADWAGQRLVNADSTDNPVLGGHTVDGASQYRATSGYRVAGICTTGGGPLWNFGYTIYAGAVRQVGFGDFSNSDRAFAAFNTHQWLLDARTATLTGGAIIVPPGAAFAVLAADGTIHKIMWGGSDGNLVLGQEGTQVTANGVVAAHGFAASGSASFGLDLYGGTYTGADVRLKPGGVIQVGYTGSGGGFVTGIAFRATDGSPTTGTGSLLLHNAMLGANLAYDSTSNLVNVTGVYPASNPSGFVTSSALAGYATALSVTAAINALPTVARSGAYADLTGKPVLFDGTYSALSGKPSLATVATSGAYADLSGAPVLATVATSGLISDTAGTLALARGGTGATTASAARTALGLATVAATGAYSDLAGAPAAYTLPTASTTVTGGVRIDGSTITIASGVVSAVQPAAGSAAPLAPGTATAGTSAAYARQDHVHPTDTTRLAASSNLSDVASVTTARTNLGLGGAAVLSVGTATGTVAAGDDSRITGAQTSAQVSTAIAGGTAANVSGTVTVTHGGTGATTANLARVAINQGTASLTSGTTIATDASLGNVFTLTLATNATLSTPTNLAAGASYIWRITQDGTGSRTLAYGSAFKWPGGTAPTLSTAAGAVDLISAVSDGTAVYAVCTKAFA